MTAAGWLQERIDGSPALLRSRLAEVVAGLGEKGDLAGALLAAAGAELEGVRGRLDEREAAFDLLVADALLTLACEAAAFSDPATVEERCRAMGPDGALGKLAESWAGRR
jgi:VIT1/CCC1 family predicted Fe2+/Mn2+ transporter